jgi:two-component system response regulator PilR (NtrC family)
MSDGDQITLADLPGEIVEAGGRDSRGRFRLPSSGIDLDKELDSFEKRWLQEALQQSKQVKAEAARLLGVDRNRLNYLCRKHHL